MSLIVAAGGGSRSDGSHCTCMTYTWRGRLPVGQVRADYVYLIPCSLDGARGAFVAFGECNIGILTRAKLRSSLMRFSLLGSWSRGSSFDGSSHDAIRLQHPSRDILAITP